MEVRESGAAPLFLGHGCLSISFTPKVWTVTFSRDNWNSELSLSLPIHSCSTGPFHGPLSKIRAHSIQASLQATPCQFLPRSFVRTLFLKSLSVPPSGLLFHVEDQMFYAPRNPTHACFTILCLGGSTKRADSSRQDTESSEWPHASKK